LSTTAGAQSGPRSLGIRSAIYFDATGGLKRGAAMTQSAEKGKRLKEPLSVTHPQLAAEWHATKNGDLRPEDVVAGSDRKVWWKCAKVDGHEWESAVKNRARGSGCPYCSGRKVGQSNSLATLYPEIANQWHPTRNCNLRPEDLTAFSNKRVWWKCPVAEDHEWESTVANRTGGRGCPCCSNDKVVKTNCLSTTHPDLAAQWHPLRNGKLTPADVTAGSNKRVWWKCQVAEDHEWETTVSNRTTLGTGCPCCANLKVVKSNCLSTSHPRVHALNSI